VHLIGCNAKSSLSSQTIEVRFKFKSTLLIYRMPTTNVARQPPSTMKVDSKMRRDRPLSLPNYSTGVNPAADAGDTSPNILVGGRQREYPPVLLRTLGYSRPILVALLYDATNSVQSGRQTVGSQGSSPQPRTRVDATEL